MEKPGEECILIFGFPTMKINALAHSECARGGPVTLIISETAVVVSPRNKNEVGVVQGLSDAIKKLDDNEQGRLAMSQASLAHARGAMSWENRAYGIFSLLDQVRHGD